MYVFYSVTMLEVLVCYCLVKYDDADDVVVVVVGVLVVEECMADICVWL